MIRKGLLERIYSAASIQRWNDHVRPVEFTELDKQAHKMVITYVLGKYEESEGGVKPDWVKLIEGGMFEFLQRVILTDIKPPVFHKLIEKKGEELNRWVVQELASDIEDIGDFRGKMEEYLLNTGYSKKEKRILKAAHYMATNWEFKIIYNIAPFVYGVDKTKENIENQIKQHYDLVGVQKMLLNKRVYGFIDLCGQLRFQQRWAQTPRIPKTSVLGHMLIVAMLSYLCSRETGACGKRLYNNFFAGLFHDLPEVLTRDIVSPVKQSIEGLEDVIKEYEKIQMEEALLPLLPSGWHDELRYFLEDEFKPKIRRNGQVSLIESGGMAEYNADKYSPLDGDMVKACDHLAAFIEAAISINYGITSETLRRGKDKFYSNYRGKKIAEVNFGQLFDYFD